MFVRRSLLLPTILLTSLACADDGGQDDTGESEGETGEPASFELRTLSGGSYDVIDMHFVQCWGNPTDGYTKAVVQFDSAGMTTIESRHDDPMCADQAIDAASFSLEGSTAGDQSITSWEPGFKPAHFELPVTATRVDMTLIGEDGQRIPTRTALLVDDSVTPPRIYTGYLEGPIDEDGFPTAMYNDFLTDLDEPIWGTWVATVDAELRDLGGSSWTRCVLDDGLGVWVFERWQFENDRLSLQRFDQGDDQGCASADGGASLEDTLFVALVTNDVEAVSGPSGELTATELRLANDTLGALATRLVVLDEAADALWVSPDGEGFEPPKMLEATALTRE